MAKRIKVKAVGMDGKISTKDSYKCSNCGKTIAKYFNYCPYCGEEFDEPYKPKPNVVKKVTEEKEKMILDLYNKGYSKNKITSIVGLSYFSVLRVINKCKENNVGG